MDGTFTRRSPDGTSRTEETRTRLPASFSGQLILSGVKIDSEVAPVVDRCTEKAGAERMPFATCPVPASPLTEGYEEQLEHRPQSKTDDHRHRRREAEFFLISDTEMADMANYVADDKLINADAMFTSMKNLRTSCFILQ